MRLPGKNWVEIDLDTITHNVRMIRRRVGRGVGVIGVVKSDAYGHGASRVGLLLQSLGVEMLAVASVEEGIVLRDRGIKVPILVLGCIFPEEVGALLRHSLTPNLCERDTAKELSRHAMAAGKTVTVHVKIDTGLGSLGVHHREAAGFLREVADAGNLFIEGIFTHFSSSSETDDTHTSEQLHIFRDVVRKAESMGIRIPMRHTANSGAILRIPEASFNAVRPGMLLYGLYQSLKTSNERGLSIGIRPAMSLKSRIGFIKNISTGETVSYGQTFRAGRPTRVGILPLGYDNGYSRALSNRSEVVIRGRRAPVIGRVRMNHIQVDVTDIPEAKVGDSVILFGGHGDARVSAEEVAGLMETVPYEVVCAAGRSNPKIYINEATGDEQNEGSVHRPASSVPLHTG
ncbi:MAG: alanine racemase [Planctomycetota bacterium]